LVFIWIGIDSFLGSGVLPCKFTVYS